MELKNKTTKNSISKAKVFTVALFAVLFMSVQSTYAHCDSYDGPVIKEAQQALATNNVNLVLKWIAPADEAEIITLFDKTYELKDGDSEIYAIVEKHFLETLVRLHRATEGVGYTGLKPAGSTSPIIKMADNAIETESVDDLLSKFTAHIEKVLREKFDKVQKLGVMKNESVEKGRVYVDAYVDYTHTLEEMHGIIEHGPGAHEH